MRFSDAPCNPRSGFHHARPFWGALYRYCGLAVMAILVIWMPDTGWDLACAMGACVFLWLAAWWQEVGNRYRCFIVASMWIVAVQATAWKLGAL